MRSSRASFTTKNGKPDDAIFAIVKQSPATRAFELVGTGFFIGVEGFFMTAKHVIKDAYDKADRHEGAKRQCFIFNNGERIFIERTRHFKPHPD